MNRRMSEGSSERGGFNGLCGGHEVVAWWHVGCVVIVSYMWDACGGYGLYVGSVVVVSCMWVVWWLCAACELWDGHDGHVVAVGCM